MNTLWNDRPDPQGIHFRYTPGHGYIVLSSARLAAMPAVLKTSSRFYDAGSSYFEEDSEWARVACAFPQYFTGQEQQNAQETLAHYHPDIFLAWGKQGRPIAQTIEED